MYLQYMKNIQQVVESLPSSLKDGTLSLNCFNLLSSWTLEGEGAVNVVVVAVVVMMMIMIMMMRRRRRRYM